MTRLTVFAWACAAGLGLALTLPAQAQTKPTVSTKKASAKKTPAKKRAAPVAAPEAPPPPADDAQRAAAELVYVGPYACELGKNVAVQPSAEHAAYVDVVYGKTRYLSKPVLSSTGAIRLEDIKGQTLMVQIAMKSMLLDVKAGQRLADDCVSEKQADARRVAALQEAAAKEAAAQQATLPPTEQTAAAPAAAPLAPASAPH